MMLAHPQMDAVLDFSSGKVNTMVIENPGFFRQVVSDIHWQIQGFSGKTVLSENDVPVEFAKHAELVDSLLSYDFCRKSLLNKIAARLESDAVSSENYMRTAQLMGELEQYIAELSFDLPCDIQCSKMSIGGVLRSAGIEIRDDYGSDLERLLDYMELTRELEREKLFIVVNLRSFYADGDVAAFFAAALSHEHKLLLIDSLSRAVLPVEHRVTVDIDLCEF